MPPSRFAGLRPLFSPLFIVCVLVLGASAVGLRPTLNALHSRYAKKPIALRRPLQALEPGALPSFRQAAPDPNNPLPLEDLGTDDAIALTLEQRNPILQTGPILLLVSYYSNPRDKVPHTPEVCYRQGGWIVEDITTTPLDVSHLALGLRTTELRVVFFKQSVGPRAAVAYLFVANGQFCWDREQVRWIICRPGDRYVYFSKVEVAVDYWDESERVAAVEVAKRLLREALAVLLADHFPRSADLRGE